MENNNHCLWSWYMYRIFNIRERFLRTTASNRTTSRPCVRTFFCSVVIRLKYAFQSYIHSTSIYILQRYFMRSESYITSGVNAFATNCIPYNAITSHFNDVNWPPVDRECRMFRRVIERYWFCWCHCSHWAFCVLAFCRSRCAIRLVWWHIFSSIYLSDTYVKNIKRDYSDVYTILNRI